MFYYIHIRWLFFIKWLKMLNSALMLYFEFHSLIILLTDHFTILKAKINLQSHLAYLRSMCPQKKCVNI